MKLMINGESREVDVDTLADLLELLGHPPASVATALNQEFVPRQLRVSTPLKGDDCIEIIAPMSGG